MADNAAPGIYTSIIDESFFVEEGGNETLVSLFPIFSPRGPDNVIHTFGSKSKNTILRVYGTPNFSKHGQSYYNALQWAGEDCETALCRLLPPDATYANIVFKYKKTKETLTEVKTATNYNGTDPVAFIEVKSLLNLSVGNKIFVSGWYKSEEITKLKVASVYTNSPLKEFEVVSIDGLKEDMKIFIGDAEVTIKSIIPQDVESGVNNHKIVIKESTITSTVAKDTVICEKVTKELPFTIKELIDEGTPKGDTGFSEAGPFKIKTKEEIRLNIPVDTAVLKRTKGVVSDYIPNATDLNKIVTEISKPIDNMNEEVIDVPFLAIFPHGRGIDYNKFSLQIIKNSDSAETYPDFAVYTMRIFDRSSENGVDVNIAGEEFEFSFYPDALDANSAFFFFADIVKTYTKCIQFSIDSYKLKQVLCDLYDLDIETTPDNEIFIKDIFQGNISFADNNKNRFKGGSDGSIWTKAGTLNWGTKDEVESGALTNATNLLVNFFNGSIDKRILNRKWVRCKYIWDANFPLPVKMSMAELVSTARPDIRYCADTGFQIREEGEISFRKNAFPVDHYNISIFPNNGEAVDKLTGKTIKVTSTYNVCKLFAQVKNNLGPHYAVAGYDKQGRLDEMKSLAYSPDANYKDAFTKNQLNTIVIDPDGIFIAENITSQKSSSALQETHISDTLQVIIVETEDFCEKKFLFKLKMTDSNLKDAESSISSFLSKWVNNGACEYIQVKVESDKRQRERRTATANISIKFAGILKVLNLKFLVKGESGTSK